MAGGVLLPGPAGHFIEYAALAGAITLTLAVTSRATWAAVGLLAVSLATLYAVSDEWHQSLVPGRAAEAADVGVDVGGAVAGSVTMIGVVWMVKRGRGGRGDSPSPDPFGPGESG